jgi:hypothetical protein
MARFAELGEVMETLAGLVRALQDQFQQPVATTRKLRTSLLAGCSVVLPSFTLPNLCNQQWP